MTNGHGRIIRELRQRLRAVTEARQEKGRMLKTINKEYRDLTCRETDLAVIIKSLTRTR